MAFFRAYICPQQIFALELPIKPLAKPPVEFLCHVVGIGTLVNFKAPPVAENLFGIFP